jgi:predicted TIM-barrel fold metal-dependent hydrolase
VDTHQHLGPEAPVDTDLVRMILADNYICTDLTDVGLTDALREELGDASVPVGARWGKLAPLWELCRHGSYAEAHWRTLRDHYGATDLAAGEIEAVSARLTADFAQPGLYRRALAERCGIETVLTQGVFQQERDPRFAWVVRPLDEFDLAPEGPFERAARAVGVELASAEDLVPAMDAVLRAYYARGAVGFKMAALPWQQPTPAEIAAAWAAVRAQAVPPEKGLFLASEPWLVLVRLYVSRLATLAAELDIPVAVHTGAPWTNWLDFRVWEPTGLIPLLQTYRDTRFDLYHAGIPYGTPLSMIGKAFPNVWLNLAWAHVISGELARRAVAEWLDLVPTSKVLGFGGDYSDGTVVLTYGHLHRARLNLAQVLGWRVKHGGMTLAQAEGILRAWLAENPRAVYRL